MDPNVHCSTLYSSQDVEATKMCIISYTDKDALHIYIYTMHYCSAITNAFSSKMDGLGDDHTE